MSMLSSKNISFYDLRNQHGLLRSIMVRNSNNNEWMVLVQFRFDESNDKEKALALLEDLANHFPQITSLLYVDIRNATTPLTTDSGSV